MHAVRDVWHFLSNGGQSLCELIGRKQGNGLEVLCRYRFEAKWRLIKLEGLLQTQVTASQFFVLSYETGFAQSPYNYQIFYR